MSNLVALDLRHRNVVRRRWSLVEGVELPLGRTVQSAQIQASWDKYIADWHAVVRWEQGRLFVKRCSSANDCGAIFYGGEERDEFALIPGEGFVIGRTIFKLDPSNTEKATGGEQLSSKTQFFRVEDLTQLNTDSS